MTTTTIKTEPGMRAEADEFGTNYFRDDHCDKHGWFENRAYALNRLVATGKPLRWIDCPQCNAVRKAEQERREREQEQQRQLETRITRAGIPYRFSGATLDSYTTTNAGQQCALEVAKGYTDDFQSTWDWGQSLLLLGNIGTGKTHIAVGIAHRAMEQGFPALFTTAADMLGKVKATWGQRGGDSEVQVIERFANVALLIIDEVGSIKCSGREREILFAILNSRHNAELPTVFTANLMPDELPSYLGDQIVSRLRESGSQSVIFGWDDYRPIKAKQAMANRSVTSD